MTSSSGIETNCGSSTGARIEQGFHSSSSAYPLSEFLQSSNNGAMQFLNTSDPSQGWWEATSI